MATADPALLDARIRAAEKTLAAHYGRTPVEHIVPPVVPPVERVETTDRTPVSTRSTSVPAGSTGVRVVEYPAVSGDEADAALPPIVLLHDIASVTALAMPLLPALSNRRILAVDWPGHGLSGLSVLPKDTDLRATVVSTLDAVLATFALESVDLVGHSLGGQFALYFALRRRGSVRRLVVLGAPGAGFAEVRPVASMRARAVPGLGTAILGLSTSKSSSAKRSAGLIGAGVLDGYPDEITEIGYLASQRSDFAPSVSSLFRTLMTPLGIRPMIALSHDELATIGVPVLMVWGDADAFLTPEKGRPSFDAIPGAELLELAGGHAPWLNDLDRVGLAVSSFLNR